MTNREPLGKRVWRRLMNEHWYSRDSISIDLAEQYANDGLEYAKRKGFPRAMWASAVANKLADKLGVEYLDAYQATKKELNNE